MKAFAISNQGIETITAAEIKELINSKNVNSSSSVITFDINDFKDLCKLVYCSQSVSRVCFLLCEFDVAKSITTTANNLKQKLKDFKISDWADEDFVVECERYGKHDFTSHDFAIAANNLISGAKVNFKSPQLRFYCYIQNNKGFFGVDVAGFDLGKREYRIFGHSSDLKATVAYSLARLSDFKPNTILLDPFSRSGAIAIEAALFASHFPVNYYRKDSFAFLKLKPFSNIDSKVFEARDKRIEKKKLQIFNYSSSIAHVRSSEKNAKIAGINKLMKFSRVDVEWLELKFDKETVDAIVSYPPMLSKNTNTANVKKLYSEFFYQADFILSKNGKIVLAARSADALTEAATKHNFRLSSKLEFSMGEEERVALVFVRG